MRIRVTQRHIRQGRQGSSFWCPIAIALREAGYTCASVNDREWLYWDGRRFIVQPTPYFWAIFIRAYDDGKPVRPFRHTLQTGEVRRDDREYTFR